MKKYNFEKFEIIKNIIEIALIFSICILLFGTLITLIYGAIEVYSINYFIVFFSIFTLFLSTLSLIIISIFYKMAKAEILYNIKKELFLFLISLASMLILSLVIHYN